MLVSHRYFTRSNTAYRDVQDAFYYPSSPLICKEKNYAKNPTIAAAQNPYYIRVSNRVLFPAARKLFSSEFIIIPGEELKVKLIVHQLSKADASTCLFYMSHISFMR